MELLIALVLFAGMIAAWLVLPGSVDTHVTAREVEVVLPTAVEQLA
jgi:hypothetical protein